MELGMSARGLLLRQLMGPRSWGGSPYQGDEECFREQLHGVLHKNQLSCCRRWRRNLFTAGIQLLITDVLPSRTADGRVEVASSWLQQQARRPAIVRGWPACLCVAGERAARLAHYPVPAADCGVEWRAVSARALGVFPEGLGKTLGFGVGTG